MKNTCCCHEGKKVNNYLSERYLKRTPPLILSASLICLPMMPARKKLQSTHFILTNFFRPSFFISSHDVVSNVSTQRSTPPPPRRATYRESFFDCLRENSHPESRSWPWPAGVPVPRDGVVGECIAVGPGRSPPREGGARPPRGGVERDEICAYSNFLC